VTRDGLHPDSLPSSSLMARTSIWCSNARGGRQPISESLSEEQKFDLHRSYFISDVQYGLSYNARLPAHKVAWYARHLGLSERMLVMMEKLMWELETENIVAEGRKSFLIYLQ
jgi:hypothetical protein